MNLNHPEILAVPLLMVADYTLTILGARESAAVYREHFVLASYEMNPLWRKSVDEIRWFNPRHFAIVCLVTLLLVLVDQVAPAELPIEFFLGGVFGAWGMVFGRHVANLLLFRYLKGTSRKRHILAGALAGGLGTVGSALLLALLLAGAGDDFLGVAKLALAAHLPVVLIEATISGFVVSFLFKVKPELLRQQAFVSPTLGSES